MAKSSKSMKDMTLTGLGSLIKHLPTGTVFLFQFLNPVLTNGGNCHPVNKYLSGALISVCAMSCVFATFTDSYTGIDGNTHYAIATFKGLWPSPDASDSVDLSKYKIRFGDYVHGFFSLIVFGVVSLLNSDTVECFYPSFESTEQILLMTLPPVIGTVSGTLFLLFPTDRHGIGYPTSKPTDNDDDDS